MNLKSSETHNNQALHNNVHVAGASKYLFELGSLNPLMLRMRRSVRKLKITILSNAFAQSAQSVGPLQNPYGT